MKKLTTLLILLLLSLSLLSCQQEEGPSGSDSMSAQEYAAYQDRILDLYAPAILYFELNPSDYTVVVGNCTQYKTFDDEAIPPTAFVGLDMLIIQESGDCVPLYFWNNDSSSMLVLAKDESGYFTKYTFHLEPSPDLTNHDFRNYWTQTSEPEIWTPS